MRYTGHFARLCHLAAAPVPMTGEAWAVRLPGPLAALYYPLRALRLACWSAWVAKRATVRGSGPN